MWLFKASMAGRRERLAIAALQDQPARAGVVDVAADDAVARSAGDADAELPHVADFAGLEANTAAPAHFDTVAQAGFHEKPAKDRYWLLQRPAESTDSRGHSASTERSVTPPRHLWRAARGRVVRRHGRCRTRRADPAPPRGSAHSNVAAKDCPA